MRIWNGCGEESKDECRRMKDEKRTAQDGSPFSCDFVFFVDNLSKSSHDVVFGFLLFGGSEHGFAFVVFDQFAL